MIRQIVALKFLNDVSTEKKAALYRELAALSEHIDGVLDLSTFANVSQETPVVRGFHDVFWFDFSDTHVRDAYLEHPTHKAVGAKLVAAVQDGLDGIFVIDVEL